MRARDFDRIVRVSFEEVADTPVSCVECGVELSPGVSYESVVVKRDDRLHRFAVCMDCVSVQVALFNGSRTCGELFDDIKAWCTTDVGCAAIEKRFGMMTPRGRALVEKLLAESRKERGDG